MMEAELRAYRGKAKQAVLRGREDMPMDAANYAAAGAWVAEMEAEVEMDRQRGKKVGAIEALQLKKDVGLMESFNKIYDQALKR